jgi:hypothetical protein
MKTFLWHVMTVLFMLSTLVATLIFDRSLFGDVIENFAKHWNELRVIIAKGFVSAMAGDQNWYEELQKDLWEIGC